MIAKQTNKQTNKQKINNTDRLDNKQRCICIVVIQSNEKSSMKFAARSAKTLKTMKFLPKIFFNMGVMDTCLRLLHYL